MKETVKEKMRKRLVKALGNESGVTLIELLAVVVILAIIAAVAVPAVMGNMNDAKANTDTQSEKIIQDAINRLYLSNSDQTITITSGTLDNGKTAGVATITIGSSTEGLGDVLDGTTTSVGSVKIAGGPFINEIPSAKSITSGKFTVGDGTTTYTSPKIPFKP